MKTPEELIPDEMPCCEIWRNMFRDVQLDAFKAGAEWAAKICFESARVNLSQEVHNIGNVILGEASNLKEIPK